MISVAECVVQTGARAPHIVHTPLQVPPEFYHRFDFMADSDNDVKSRQTYHAMVDFADAAIGNFTAAVKAKRMWDDMIIVFSADNGGPVYVQSCCNKCC